jgi:cytochrome c-type biogenesis protein CcmH
MKRLVALALLLIGMALPAAAVEPDEMLADPGLESRAREISQELRCLVCQNQSIDDSDAQLAKDLRLLVRERLKAGNSDRQVLDYVVSRYGDFVLLRPPFKLATYALWFGPALILGLGVLAVIVFYRRRGGAALDAPAPLTADESRRLARLLDGDGPS